MKRPAQGWIEFFCFFLFCVDNFKSLYWICYNTACFTFWCFGPKACGILGAQPGIKPIPPALEGKVLAAGPLRKSLDWILTKKRGQGELGGWRERGRAWRSSWYKAASSQRSCWEWLLRLWRLEKVRVVTPAGPQRWGNEC